MSKAFIDTSALLHQNIPNDIQLYVSPVTLKELENIKNSVRENEYTRYRAREAVRYLLNAKNVQIIIPDNKKIAKMIKKYSFLNDINDHYILCAAELLAIDLGQQITFITNDSMQYIFALQMPHLIAVHASYNEKEDIEGWGGWSRYYPNEKEMASLYSDPKTNILGCHINEYAEIYEGTILKDILVWTGKEYRPLKYKEIKNDFLGQTIKPLNVEQRMAFDLLQNPNIPVKLLTGVPGGGKDFLMFLHAWDLIQKGKKDKIIFIRNLVPFKDAPEIGFLEGSLQKKIEWGLGPIESILGEDGLKIAQESGQIEAVNLGFIRGMSWDNVILYVSEGQNITGGGYKLLVSRCGKNSELWINGDTLQTDGKKFESNNGIERMLHAWRDNTLFGTIKLLKTERSAVAELASCL